MEAVKESKPTTEQRPFSASAGQRFIGSTQNMKDLFHRNWQRVNVTQKTDNQGNTSQIRTLTTMDTQQMVAD